jgi:hypothetical protein
MKLKNRAFILTASVWLWFAASAHAEVAQTGDPWSPQQIFRSASAIQSLVLVSSAALEEENATVGYVLVYDDPGTKRSEDYFELYDSWGSLVAVGWYDRFGIQRIAVDRGLFDDAQEPQGVFVTLVDGSSI